MLKVGDVVTVHINPYDNTPWKNTGVITEIEDTPIIGHPVYHVQFLDDRIGWWYVEKELYRPTTNDMMEVIRKEIMK